MVNTLSMARKLASRSITVSAVARGYIEAAMTAALDEKRRQAFLSHLYRWHGPGGEEDVAHAVAFLASPRAGYISGHVLDVNGGLFMSERLMNHGGYKKFPFGKIFR